MMTEALMHALQAAALWSGLLILLLLVLAGVVSSGRRRHMVSLGDGGNADLQAATRALMAFRSTVAPLSTTSDSEVSPTQLPE